MKPPNPSNESLCQLDWFLSSLAPSLPLALGSLNLMKPPNPSNESLSQLDWFLSSRWLRHRRSHLLLPHRASHASSSASPRCIFCCAPTVARFSVFLFSAGDKEVHDILAVKTWLVLQELRVERVNAATSQKLTETDWMKNIEICELVAHDQRQARDVIKAIKKRLGNKNPNIQLYAVMGSTWITRVRVVEGPRPFSMAFS